MDETTPILKERKQNGTVIWIDQDIKDAWLNLSQSGHITGSEAKMLSRFVKNTARAKIEALKQERMGGSQCQ